jgi:hypothetical protein
VVVAITWGGCAAFVVVLLNRYTGGRYFDNTIQSNLNQMDARKAIEQTEQLLVNGGWMIVLAAAGLRRAWRGGIHPFYVYLGCALAVLAATAAKLGSDLNYQMEVMIALGLCSGWMLDQIHFTPPRLGWRPSLLELAPIVQIAINLAMGGMFLHQRLDREQVARQETALLEPYIRGAAGRVLSVQLDPIVQLGGHFDATSTPTT